MRVLIVKLSSLGDVVHALPALTDARAALPNVRFDWVVESAFAAIPRWHPAVGRVFPVALRRWRTAAHRHLGDWRAFQRDLRAQRYDLVIDAQGLIKSALVALLAQGPRAGFEQGSIREPLASICYHARYRVSRDLHAVGRVRALFAQALGYCLPGTAADAGIVRPAAPGRAEAPYVVLLPGTTWPDKRWPLARWRQLAQTASDAGLQVAVACAGAVEREHAETIVAGLRRTTLLCDLTLPDVAAWLAHASGVVGVDTGLAHLAAAFGTPTLTLHGPTDAARTGVQGARSGSVTATLACAPCGRRVCSLAGAPPVEVVGGAPCMNQLYARTVWQLLAARMADIATPIAVAELRA